MYEDESLWVKANPSLPVVPGYDYIRNEVNKAKGMPSKQAVVNRLVFGVWSESGEPWIDVNSYLACEVEPDEFEFDTQEPIYVGLDLAESTDLCAAVVCQYRGGKYYADCKLWTPEEGLDARSSRDGVLYQSWVDEGMLELVPGKVVRFSLIAKWLSDLREQYVISGIAHDPWGIKKLMQELDDVGFPYYKSDMFFEGSDETLFIRHEQGFRGSKDPVDPPEIRLVMPTSITALEEAILTDSLVVPKLASLRSNVLGMVIYTNESGARRADKNKSTTRIDAGIALIMAVGLARAHQDVMRSEGFDGSDDGLLEFIPPEMRVELGLEIAA